MPESIGLYVIPVDSALGLFSLTAMATPLEKVLESVINYLIRAYDGSYK